MECELCGLEKASQFKATDWGDRHVCGECAPQIVLSNPATPEPPTKDRFSSAAKRFLADLGYGKESVKRPPNKPK
jgi:hypothetical protein